MVTKNTNKRRFEDKDRKPWTKEEREAYEKAREKLRPFVRDLTTPHVEEKKPGLLDDLFS
jgi:hypothetical protein